MWVKPCFPEPGPAPRARERGTNQLAIWSSGPAWSPPRRKKKRAQLSTAMGWLLHQVLQDKREKSIQFHNTTKQTSTKHTKKKQDSKKTTAEMSLTKHDIRIYKPQQFLYQIFRLPSLKVHSVLQELQSWRHFYSIKSGKGENLVWSPGLNLLLSHWYDWVKPEKQDICLCGCYLSSLLSSEGSKIKSLPSCSPPLRREWTTHVYSCLM